MDKSNYDILKEKTIEITSLWKNTKGFAPSKVATKLENAMLNWQCDLTNTLKIWIDKGCEMNEGELILARVNLGCIVESWLKFFYCVYYNDYQKNPIKTKKKNMIEPEDASFEKLKEFSTGILWDDKDSPEYTLVGSIQDKRNAIHSFKYRDIGTPQDFLNDVDQLLKFVEEIQSRLPPIEDFVELSLNN